MPLNPLVRERKMVRRDPATSGGNRTMVPPRNFNTVDKHCESTNSIFLLGTTTSNKHFASRKFQLVAALFAVISLFIFEEISCSSIDQQHAVQ